MSHGNSHLSHIHEKYVTFHVPMHHLRTSYVLSSRFFKEGMCTCTTFLPSHILSSCFFSSSYFLLFLISSAKRGRAHAQPSTYLSFFSSGFFSFFIFLTFFNLIFKDGMFIWRENRKCVNRGEKIEMAYGRKKIGAMFFFLGTWVILLVSLSSHLFLFKKEKNEETI